MSKNDKMYAVEFLTITGKLNCEIFDSLEEAEIFFDRIPENKGEHIHFQITRLSEVEKVVIRNNSYYVVTDILKTK